MKKKSLLFCVLACFLSVVFVGCGSMYNYKVKPTPIKKGQDKFILEDFNLTLTHGHGRNFANTTFKNQKELKESFVDFINKNLKKQNLHSSNPDEAYKVKIQMNYQRRYNTGGNALNKPYFDYDVEVFDKNNKLLVTYRVGTSTTEYSYLKDIAVNAEIAVFKWNAEDEPQDIELISKTIVEELAEIGN